MILDLEKELASSLPKAYRFVSQMVPSADVEDVVGTAVMRVVEKLHLFERRSGFNTWFYKIVHGITIDYLRRKELEYTKQSEMETRVETFYVWNAVNDRIMSQRILERLNEKDRVTLTQRFLEGMSLSEIGQSAGISENAARLRVGLALRHARRDVLKHEKRAKMRTLLHEGGQK